MKKANVSSLNMIIELDSGNGYSIELRGYAAEQWIEAKAFEKSSARIRQYLLDLSLWAQIKILNPNEKSLLDILVDEENLVYCTSFRSATVLFYQVRQKIVVRWLSGLFRPLSEFAPVITRPSLH